MLSLLTDNIIGILIGSVALLTYLYLRKALNYFEDRGLPYVKSTWMETIQSFTLDGFNKLPNQIYEKKAGSKPYIGFFHTGFVPALVVLDSSQVKDILIKDFSHFQDHGFEQDTTSDPLGKHLFNMKGDEWRTLRLKLIPTFTSGKLKGMLPLIEDCAEDLLKDMKGNKKFTRDVNTTDLFKRYSLSMIATTAFGIDPANIKDPESEFQTVLRRALNTTFTDKLRLFVLLISPKLFAWLKLKMFPESVDSFILQLTRDVMNSRKESGVKRNDFIQLLIELKEKGQVEMDVRQLEENEKENINSFSNGSVNTLEMTHELLSAQVLIFLLAGYENIAFAITVTIYALSKHPNIQNRVREEVKTVRGKYPRNETVDGTSEYLALKDMTLLGACIDEALRLYTPTYVIARECTKPYTFKDGRTIEKGLNVLIPTKAIQLDERHWANPHEYNPDRFLDGTKIHQGTYLPFGDGPRLCIAQRLALMTAKALVAKLVENFEILPSPKMQEPLEIDIQLTANIRGGAWATFKPLQPNNW